VADNQISWNGASRISDFGAAG